MNEERRDFQHIRVDELDERGLCEDGCHCHQQFHHGHESTHGDIYGVYATQNNMGVMLLREKRYLDAANSFCQAVKYVNEKSQYNFQRNDDSQTCNNRIEYNNNHNDDDCSENRRQSPPTFTQMWNEMDSSSSSSISSFGAIDDSTSSSDGIDSFYLLLDEQAGSEIDLDNNRKDDQSSPSPYSVGSNEFYSPNRIQDDETFVFRNPIIVTKRGAPQSSRRLSPRHSSISTTSSSYATQSSRTDTNSSLETNNTPTPETATRIDKESCAKLSLVSVYNMALTYHLAALDNDKTSAKSEDDRPKAKHAVAQNTSGSDNGAIAKYFPTGPGTRDGAPRAKRRRSLEYNSSSNNDDSNTTTAVTPFGECNTPYKDCSPSTKNSPKEERNIHITTNVNNTNEESSKAVDRVLLGQALAYYQIAYRILVSERRVLVSQAMVILNNIGHIHRLMGKDENAKRCFQRLLTTMIYLQQTGDANQISHWDCFLTNVIDLIIPSEHSHKNFAPAA